MVDRRIEFLYNAISDAQDLIKFIETKTAIVITIISSYIIGFFVSIEKLFLYAPYYSMVFWILLMSFFTLMIICILVTTRIIKPVNNPADHVNFGTLQKPDLKFFLAVNIHCRGFMFFNSSKCKLHENFEIYVKQLNLIGSDDLIKTLTFELFKISFIRNIKNERFNWLLFFLVITTIVFLVAYLFYSSETKNAVEIVEMLKKYRK